jgi:hypothetical protein
MAMKAGLKRQNYEVNRRQKYGGAEKSGQTHFFARLIFLPSLRWAANRAAQARRADLSAVVLTKAEAAAAKAGQSPSKWIKPVWLAKLARPIYANT